jgi:hypothetical protein
VAAQARALGDVVGRYLVKGHHSQRGHHRGTGLFYKPVAARHVGRSHLYEEGKAEGDAEN